MSEKDTDAKGKDQQDPKPSHNDGTVVGINSFTAAATIPFCERSRMKKQGFNTCTIQKNGQAVARR